MKYLLIGYTLIILSTQCLFTQSISLNGKLINEKSGEAVPYGAIRIDGLAYGAISNAEGEFELKFPRELLQSQKNLIVSSIGFHNYRVRISQIQEGEYLRFLLKERPYTLQDVMIYSTDLTARQLVAEAFKRIPQNYPTKPYLLKTFYRHYCKENEQYGRLIEAAVDVYDPKGYKKLRNGPGNKVELKVQQLRRSFDYTTVGTVNRHMPIALNTTLIRDIAGYKSRLSSNINKERYKFTYADTTFYDDQLVYVVNCKGKNYENEIFISAADLAFLRLEEQRYSYSNNKSRKYWRKEHYITTYKKQNNKYYLSHLTNEGENETILKDSTGKEIDRSGHYHHVEMMINEIKTSNFSKFKGKEPTKETLLKVPYNPSFWKNYNILKATPLEGDIEADLARRMPLEQQFTTYHKQSKDPDFHDRLMAQRFDAFLHEQRGRIVVVYFWDTSKLPSLKEMLVARKVAKKFQNEPIGAILVSMDSNEGAWKKMLQKYGLAREGNLRLALGAASPLARRYGVKGSPHYLIFDKDGNVAFNLAELPKRKRIEEELRRLLDM